MNAASTPVHPAFTHRTAGVVSILCHASGESECPGVAIATNRDQVRTFIIGQWCGGEGQELDEAMAEFDSHDWDDEPYIEWTFEIGGVKLEQVYEAATEPKAGPRDAAIFFRAGKLIGVETSAGVFPPGQLQARKLLSITDGYILDQIAGRVDKLVDQLAK